MATQNKKTNSTANRKKTSSKSRSDKNTSNNRNYTSRNNKKTNTSTSKKNKTGKELEISNDIKVILLLTVTVILTLSNFSLCGRLGKILSDFMFGLVGVFAYILPILIFIGIIFFAANISSKSAIHKLIAAIVMFLVLCALVQLYVSGTTHGMIADNFYKKSIETHFGGGIIGGGIGVLLCKLVSIYGAYIILIALLLVTLVIITEKTIVSFIRSKSQNMVDYAKDDFERLKENSANRIAKKEQNKMERAKKKVRGVALSKLEKPEHENGNIHEINVHNSVFQGHVDCGETLNTDNINEEYINEENTDISKFNNNIGENNNQFFKQNVETEINNDDNAEFVPKEQIQVSKAAKEVMSRKAFSSLPLSKSLPEENNNIRSIPDAADDLSDTNYLGQGKPSNNRQIKKSDKYIMPPLSLLKKGTGSKRSDGKVIGLSKTAKKLQDTLNAFGVKANVIDESRGPSVTRYELAPETGTKVSRITSLSDDIKLNLAAADIRIEAPIPGKAAVGIEVPNDKRESVYLRDLIESQELVKHPSKISFAAGMDIAGKVVVADIAKMPHMLIAGTTGSGKSVFTNSIIMSILFRAKPDEVKLIIVDPKVVEFGVYNGIPHLLTPVVTDPRKAAGALNWAVAEMGERYLRFAKYGVRDLKGYNEKIKEMSYKDGEEQLKPIPQIVIIIDELADLMMVAAKDVESAICRLAQLARAAGIHLIIATQRPSVDVVTGLIKANIPSRVALLVSSGTDSRTIIDCNGGEKLLGNGDMLFYPSGYVKPVRLQGAFVSDKEVADVVNYIITHNQDAEYNEAVTNAELPLASGNDNSQGTGNNNDNGRDELFEQAGRFVIEKEKGSTSMLQRMFKIGFNRAARIIDQLESAGVVGSDEGTKPRKVLMTIEEFEQII